VRLIPPTIPPDTPSDGEKLVFERLAADSAQAGAAGRSGPDTSDWTVLHSLDVANHRRQQQGEIDFACVVPGCGVLCLEVKGCHRLHRSKGVWYYGADAAGDPRGPFKQASEAMHSLRERLQRKRAHLKGIPFQSAVCFPFLDFSLTSEEWHDWQVIDRRDLEAQPIADLIAAVLDRARERAVQLRQGWFHPDEGAPTAAQCDELVRVLRPDFEFYESPRVRARRLDEEIRRYTEEQFAVLDQLARNPRVIVDGPAGTGKTVLAIEQARRSVGAGHRVLLLCFNRPLSKWLAAEAEGTTVLTLHEYMRRVAGVEFTEEQLHEQGFWQDELPTLALERLMDGGGEALRALVGGGAEAFDELILDEGQDMLRESYLDVLDLSLKGGLAGGRFRIFGDFAHQAIYDAAVMSFADLQRRCPGAVIADLKVNCRNTPRVVALAKGRDAPTSGDDAVAWDKVSRPDDGVDPVVRFYRDAEHQCELLAQALQELHDEGFTGPQVAVLSPHNDHACAAAGFCGLTGEPTDANEAGLSAADRQAWRDRLAPLVPPGGYEPDMRSGKTKYASIYRFKGLEARAVVLTDIERLETEHERDLFYIGATRATQRLAVLAHEGLKGQFRQVAT
jgi:DNA replication protein DnaC